MSAHPTIAGFGYHEITDDPSASGFQRTGARPYTLTPRAFAAHLDQMAASEARPMRVTDIDFTRSGRCLVLTFDDGGKSAVHAGDALARRGWTGHFFIVSSLIGTRTFATASDIRYLASCGHVVGTHTHTHPDIFPDLTPERMLEEWRTSGDAISEIVGAPCLTASVPGGDISRQVLESAARAGVQYLFTSEPWLSPRDLAAGARVGGSRGRAVSLHLGALALTPGDRRLSRARPLLPQGGNVPRPHP